MALFRHTTKRNVSHNQAVGDKQPYSSVTMEDIESEVMRALWHPFEQLDSGNKGQVQVSRLKVITASIGLKLGYNKAETLLNKDGVTSMTFVEFFEIIKTELLDKIQDTPPTEDENTSAPHSHHINTKPTLPELLNGIIKTCWTFCSFESVRHNKAPGMTIENCMVLWRLFNFLSECDENRTPVIPVRMHREEVILLLRDFIDYTGQRNKEDVVKEFSDEPLDSGVVRFTELLNWFEKDFANTLSRNDITQCLNHLFDFYIMNVLDKKMMSKRGFKVKHWSDRYFVLTTVSLKYYKETEKFLKGEIVFDSECSVEVLADRPTHRPNRFIIHTSKKPYEISAPDAKTKNEWVSAIQVALKCIGGNPNIQKEAAFQRCLERIKRKRRLEGEEKMRLEEAKHQRKQQEELNEEKRKRLEDEELLKARQDELEEERKRRAEMEDKLLEEQRLREEEQHRLRDLEAIKQELERLLEDERQAKKDEEIVRNLQARLLEEEFQKREDLERLQQQQQEMLRAEREQKAVLEGDRKEQERILLEAKERLEQLERERAAAADKMQEASEKLQRAEKDRHIMEERVKLYKTKTSVGLKRPTQATVGALTTHRGHGAFCEKDFVRKQVIEEDQDASPHEHELFSKIGGAVEDTNKIETKMQTTRNDEDGNRDRQNADNKTDTLIENKENALAMEMSKGSSENINNGNSSLMPHGEDENKNSHDQVNDQGLNAGYAESKTQNQQEHSVGTKHVDNTLENAETSIARPTSGGERIPERGELDTGNSNSTQNIRDEPTENNSEQDLDNSTENVPAITNETQSEHIFDNCNATQNMSDTTNENNGEQDLDNSNVMQDENSGKKAKQNDSPKEIDAELGELDSGNSNSTQNIRDEPTENNNEQDLDNSTENVPAITNENQSEQILDNCNATQNMSDTTNENNGEQDLDNSNDENSGKNAKQNDSPKEIDAFKIIGIAGEDPNNKVTNTDTVGNTENKADPFIETIENAIALEMLNDPM